MFVVVVVVAYLTDMRLVSNQFAAFAVLLLAQLIPTATIWFLIIVFSLSGMADRDWFVDITFTRDDLIKLLKSLRNGLPSGWPWGRDATLAFGEGDKKQQKIE